MNPSFQRSLERYMRLEETPEEDLERMGELEYGRMRRLRFKTCFCQSLEL